jgi:hypothetical protein
MKTPNTVVSRRGSHVLHLFAAVLVNVCLGAALFAGTYGGVALKEFYHELPMPLTTMVARSVASWAPMLAGVLSLSLVGAGIRGVRSPWFALVVLAIAILALAMVAVGITLPYSATTFRLGSPQ